MGGTGEPVEWLVKMRRLPTDRTLEQLFIRGELRPADIERLAETLAKFYRGLSPVHITAAEYLGSIAKHVQQNRAELQAVSHHLPSEQVERVHERQPGGRLERDEQQLRGAARRLVAHGRGRGQVLLDRCNVRCEIYDAMMTSI